MKSAEEIKSFCREHLSADLYELERIRIRIYRKICALIIFGLTAAAVVAGVLYWKRGELSGDILRIFIWPVMLAVSPSVWLWHRLGKNYRREFKKRIIEKIVKCVDESLYYFPEDHIPRSAYLTSGLFRTEDKRYRGDDLVVGKIGDIEIEFSEIHSEYYTQSKHGKQWHTIFKGLFYIADFNKRLSCRTVVVPDTAERIFGSFGTSLQRMSQAQGQLVKLENAEFEKFYAVYSNDQVEARYVLSTSMMERIVEFSKKCRKSIYISFTGSKIYIGIPYSNDLFEPSVMKSLLDHGPIQEYFNNLDTAVGIVEELKLNLRILGKTNMSKSRTVEEEK